MRDMKRDLLDAIELCKTQSMCDLCPMREEICDSLNFSSAAYFRKVFQSIYKKSPTQMRKEDTKPAL